MLLLSLDDTFKTSLFYYFQLTTETTDFDDSKIGGNASAEGGAEESADPSSVSGVDVVLRHRLVETGFGKKKEYQTYIKVRI